ncbi:MAG: large conductance mechanosensitive channel protein MscL [Candidatus Pacebacteria bacterium CG_4_10_14_0_8_um_filter_43_12]|nr:MAG: large conductance mechanosensitive channel protein MscL [Candidatus Pacebacteria bacterium CG_4_10_14_0_8_um_filter_43_12]
MLNGFKQFILKGNVVDLAVGVVIGATFNTMVTALVKDVINPMIGVFGGTPDFSKLHFTINNSQFMIGDFLNTVLAFLINASIIYFFVVLPMNKLVRASRKEKPVDPTTKKCPFCVSVIPINAKRCPFCTSSLISKS